ncbi:hypothetical protein EI94DRAFT_1601208 [Lactarius quietus]|nr:hypothetical protein EI94DRAFT_1601208 [Lactarius quietus]
MVVIEVNPDLERFRELLGQHVWSEFLLQPTKEQRGKSSTVFYSTFHTSRLVNNGWKCVKIEEHLFQEWADNDPYRNP